MTLQSSPSISPPAIVHRAPGAETLDCSSWFWWPRLLVQACMDASISLTQLSAIRQGGFVACGIIQHGAKERRNAVHTVRIKPNNTPVTDIDYKSEQAIAGHLHQADTTVPIIGEENAHPSRNVPTHRQRYWLVDPLDGTANFLRGGDDYAINIALMEPNPLPIQEEKNTHHPILGVLIHPPSGTWIWGCLGGGVWQGQCTSDDLDDHSIPLQWSRLEASWPPQTQIPDNYRLRIIGGGGKNFPEKVSTFIHERDRHPLLQRLSSARKMMLMACGKADIYPCWSPTMSWDTAAGHAILQELGGNVVNSTGQPLAYTPQQQHNPPFVALIDQRMLSRLELNALGTSTINPSPLRHHC